MGPHEPTKGNAQLENDFPFTQIKLVYCLTRKTLKWNSLVQKICLFLQKETSHCKSSLTTTFTRKMPRSSDSMYFFYFMLENIWHHYFTWSVPNSQKNCEICSNYGSPGIRIKLEQIHNFLWIGFTSGNMMISYVF